MSTELICLIVVVCVTILLLLQIRECRHLRRHLHGREQTLLALVQVVREEPMGLSSLFNKVAECPGVSIELTSISSRDGRRLLLYKVFGRDGVVSCQSATPMGAEFSVSRMMDRVEDNAQVCECAGK